MLIPKPTLQQLEARLGPLKSIEALGGGCICQAFKLQTTSHTSYFLKTLERGPNNLFKCEAYGLNALSDVEVINTPNVIAWNTSYLLLEYIPEHPANDAYWDQLGEQLAHLHCQQVPAFGFSQDNYCGSTVQPNPKMDNGFEFFIQHRLQHQLNLAQQQSLLSQQDLEAFEGLQQKITALIPDEPPTLLHGDLWSGNIHCGPDHTPYLIDPACYWGWRETDIAMTKLFGGFSPRFYQAYHHHNPLQPGWEDRLDLHNLYPLLNHLNLFGRSYLTQIRQILNRFV